MTTGRIRWISDVRLELIGPRGVISVRPIESGELIPFGLATFGGPGNLALSLQIYAPGVTDKIKDYPYPTQFDLGRRAIEMWGLMAESNLIVGNTRHFAPGSHAGKLVGGWDNHDLLAYWALGDPGNTNGGHLNAGIYDVTVVAEAKTMVSFKLTLV